MQSKEDRGRGLWRYMRHKFSLSSRDSRQLHLGYLGWLGAIASTTSVFSVLDNVFHLQFAKLFEDFLDLYRGVWHTPLNWIWSALSFRPPVWINDVLALWCISGSVAFRTYVFARRCATDRAAIEHKVRVGAGDVEMDSRVLNNSAEPTLITAPAIIFYPLYIFLCFGLTPLAILRLFYLKPITIALWHRLSNAPTAIAARLTPMLFQHVRAMALAIVLFFAINGGISSVGG